MGRAWKYGDDVNTDEIIPARYLNTSDPAELAKHCMEDGDQGAFAGEHAAGDVIVAGRNFGCGSSREHAPIAIKEAGVSAVIAESFARIFFRNCINIGLPILESPEAAGAIAAGDEVAPSLLGAQVATAESLLPAAAAKVDPAGHAVVLLAQGDALNGGVLPLQVVDGRLGVAPEQLLPVVLSLHCSPPPLFRLRWPSADSV